MPRPWLPSLSLIKKVGRLAAAAAGVDRRRWAPAELRLLQSLPPPPSLLGRALSLWHAPWYAPLLPVDLLQPLLLVLVLVLLLLLLVRGPRPRLLPLAASAAMNSSICSGSRYVSGTKL